jgi:acetyltransferase
MLESLLKPGVIAIMGASRTPGKVGNAVVVNLINGGFEGEMVPVNPSGGELQGQKFYTSLAEYGKSIDASVICVPTKAVKQAVQDSVDSGAKAVVVITAGFKEVDEAGAQLEREIVDICHAKGARLMGPNCLGIINTHNKMNATFGNFMPQPGAISVLSQSGALCTAILDWASARKMGLATLLSIGNKADLNETDFLSAFATDDNTKVIVGYLESIINGDEFIRVAEQVASVKPVVILKSGTTSAGSKAASSHTGALAGADIAYGAAFRRAGVIRAETFESLFDYAAALAMQPIPKGDRVAIITNAGGPGIMAADAVEHSGMTVANLHPDTAQSLREKLPPAASVGNPIDVLGDAGPERYAQAVEAAQGDDTVDAIVVILTPQAMTAPVETARAIAAKASSAKPVLAAFMGGSDVMPAREELVAANLPDYPSPERAVAALKVMVDYGAWLRRPTRIVQRFPVNRRRVDRIIARQLRTGQTYMGEPKAKEVLRAYDFNVPEGRLVTSVDEAIELAPRLGYPLAMKIVSPDIIHKSDVGGVRLNLASVQDVIDAYDLMMLRIGRRVPDAVIEGVYLEKMAPKGREVILGMTRDPQFGPMLMFGLGGIFVEVMKDVTFHLAPITSDEAMQMLMGTRSFKLLQGTRGQAGVNLAAIAEALQRISQLVTDFPQIDELDINPFICGEMGSPSYAADGRIQLALGGER